MPKTKYTKEEIGKLLNKYVEQEFSYKEYAAEHYGVSPQGLSNILSGRTAPNEKMLSDIGFMKIKPEAYFVRVK